jgi:hypothetical protein
MTRKAVISSGPERSGSAALNISGLPNSEIMKQIIGREAREKESFQAQK